jgi:hypothetical protein
LGVDPRILAEHEGRVGGGHGTDPGISHMAVM